MSEQLPKEESDTPKTDAAIFYIADKYGGNIQLAVPAEFAAAQERRIAELEEAVRNFVKGMDEAEQIRELVTKISGNPVNGVSAYVWWCSRYLNVSCFDEARKALQS